MIKTFSTNCPCCGEKRLLTELMHRIYVAFKVLVSPHSFVMIDPEQIVVNKDIVCDTMHVIGKCKQLRKDSV